MIDYNHFTSGDMKAVLELSRQLQELEPDIFVRGEHMMKGLCSLVHAQVGIFCELEDYHASKRWQIRPLLDFGWDGPAERAWCMSFFDGEQLDDPMTLACTQLEGPVQTWSREMLVDDRDWYRSPNVNELRRRGNTNDCIYSNFYLNDRPFHAMGVALHRPWGDPPFTKRDVALVDLFHRCQPVYRHDLSERDRHEMMLPPRLRQILRLLRAGHSEKEVARQLGLSRHTVHNHIKLLHKRLNVCSRGELLSRCPARQSA